MRKMIQALALAFAMCFLPCGCSQKSVSASHTSLETAGGRESRPVLVGNLPCSFPLVAEPTRLRVLISQYGDVSPDTVFVWQKYEAMTGVTVDWTPVTRAKRAEAVNAALMNKQNLDLIIRCKISANRLIQYGEHGLILDLARNDLLQKNAPNCWAYLKSHPETLASVTNPDGTIYALPQVNSGAELRVSRKLFINKAWLQNVNMPVPQTTEELYLLLKAFREQDANGNGDPNDEIPLCSADWSSIQEALSGAFGLANRGAHNLAVDCDEETGKVRYVAASDGYRDFLAYLHRLYGEELLDRYIFSMTEDQWYQNAMDDRIGVFSSTNLAGLPTDKIDNWVAVTDALEGPNGDRLWTAIRANFHSTGAAVIPATCKDPALALRWLDYFWTDEGTLFYHMGIEGETFVEKEGGTYDYAPHIYEEMKAQNLSFDDIVAQYSPYPGGGNPTVEIAPYFMGGEMADIPAQAARSLFTYGPKEYWPSFTFSASENEALDSIRTDIEKYTQAMMIEFITGTTPLSSWDDYIAQLDNLKQGEMLRIYQAAADRYAALRSAQP